MRDFNTVKSDLVRHLSLSCQKTDGEILWYNGTLEVLVEFLSILHQEAEEGGMSMGVYIPNMDAKEFGELCAEKGLQFIYIPVPPHGRLIEEADAIETAWMILRGLGYLKGENPQLEQTVREVFATAQAIEVE